MVVRSATAADIAAILEIHNQGILDRIATLDLEPHTYEQKAAWFQSHGAREPILVACEQERVVGFVALTKFSPRRCYQHIATLTIYVRREFRGQGVGSRLLGAVIQEARAIGLSKIILSAFPFNEGAIALYRRFGFRQVGVYEQQGRLDDRWVDVVIMERLLDR